MHKNIKLIDSALIKLGIGIKDGEKTSPKEMLEFMHKIDLDIEDIIAKTQSSLLKKLVTEEISLGPLKERILIGIANNPPMAQSFMEMVNLQESIKIISHKEQRQYIVYFLVILEVLTTLMVNDINSETLIANSLFKKRNSINYGSSFWNFWSFWGAKRGDLFRSLKAISVDPVIFADLCWRKTPPLPSEKDLNHFIKKEKLSGLNSYALKNLLNLQQKNIKHYGILCGNIFEALIAEEIFTNRKKNKLSDTSNSNIKAGLALILYHELFEKKFSPVKYLLRNAIPQVTTHKKYTRNLNDFWNDLYSFSVNQNYVKVTEGINQDWVNLYESWNLTFALTYFSQEIQLFLPRILIPQVISSVPKNYFASRSISLWLSINFASNLRRNKIKTTFESMEYNLLLRYLSTNNLAYAKTKLLKSEKIDLNDYYKNHIQSKSTWCLYFKALQMLRGARLMPDKENKK